MTFDELVLDYGFVTNDGSLFWKQRHQTIFLMIEKSVDSEGKERYDFYKLNDKNQVIKYYDRNINEFFLVLRVQKHFRFLAELDRKKKLESFGGSELKYHQHLRKERKNAQMNQANLVLHDGKGRRKSDNQMKMDFSTSGY